MMGLAKVDHDRRLSLMGRLREALKRCLGPRILKILAKRRGQERFYFGPRWPTDAGKGYDDPSSDEVWHRRWPTLFASIAGTNVLSLRADAEVGHDLAGHNMLMTFLFVLARASHGKDHLSVLDWGGAMGQYGLVARRLLPDVKIDYVVKDFAGVCSLGRVLNESVTFVAEDEACFARSYDVVMANSALQMAEDWKRVVRQLAKATASVLLINGVPLVDRADSFVILQQLRSRGFLNDFYSWAINRNELMTEVTGHGLVLDREVMSWGPVHYWGAPENPRGGGAIFLKS